mgnify:CR=1 FL=1
MACVLPATYGLLIFFCGLLLTTSLVVFLLLGLVATLLAADGQLVLAGDPAREHSFTSIERNEYKGLLEFLTAKHARELLRAGADVYPSNTNPRAVAKAMERPQEQVRELQMAAWL